MRVGVWAFGLLALSAWHGSALADDTAPGPRRDVIARGPRANETEGSPPGFHAEQRPRYGLIIGGAVIAGAGALLLEAGAEQRAAANRSDVDGSAHTAAGLLTATGVVHLLVGVPLLTIGLFSPREVYVRDRLASVAFAPLVSADRVGGALALSF